MIKKIGISIRDNLAFIVLFLLYVAGKISTVVYAHLGKRKTVMDWLTRFKRLNNLYGVVGVFFRASIARLDKPQARSVSKIELMDLAVKHMAAKRTRTIVTVGGMTLGIGAIVLLVSVGYGLQRLVVNRVVKLDEMRQADISTQPGSKIKIDDKVMADIKGLPKVSSVLPMIAAVAHVSYNKSVSDVAAYGVTSSYLTHSAIKPSSGRFFESNDLVTSIGQPVTDIGDETEDKSKLVDVDINFGSWIRVRSKPNTDSDIIGYTKKVEGDLRGEMIDGGEYGQGNTTWIKVTPLIWDKTKCEETNGDCENGSYVVARETDGSQTQKEGYIANLGVTLENSQVAVLGDTTVTAYPLTQVDLASESASPQVNVQKVPITSNTAREVVVSSSMANVLGLKENEALGKEIDLSFVAVDEVQPDANSSIESLPTKYKIVGVIPNDNSPLLYVPFVDIKSLGILTYSQLKLVVDNQRDLSNIRKKIEVMGLVTRSVADTVAQINNLFSTVRTFLALLGMIALLVAGLGMFNTLTVSLLERTREVGLMKAMGMRSTEVKSLFMTESMIMGLFGGFCGILGGFIVGKIIGFIISIYSILGGVGYMDISYIPLSFVIFIIVLSLVVGVITGLYPAKRTTKISALDALRYE